MTKFRELSSEREHLTKKHRDNEWKEKLWPRLLVRKERNFKVTI